MQAASAGAQAAKVAGQGSLSRLTGQGSATITRTAIKGGQQITTQRAFNVGTKVSAKLATQMSKLSQVDALGIVKRGIGLAWRHKKGIATFTGAQALGTWYALDNIMQGVSIFTRDTANAVRFGALSRGQAVAGLDDAQMRVNRARRFVNIQLVNPLMIPFSRIIRTGMAQNQAQIDLQYKLLGIER